jgi:hypothetical protein
MGKKILKLFLETMLRAVVIILAVGIIIMLALLVKTMNSNKKLTKSKETTEGVEIETEAEDEDDLTFTDDASEQEEEGGDVEGTIADSTSAKILVINATGTSGVAGSWKSTLEGKGFSSVDVGNYLPGVLTTTKVCVSGDYSGEDIIANFSSPETATVDSLSSSDFDMSVGDYDIVVIVGTSDIQ